MGKSGAAGVDPQCGDEFFRPTPLRDKGLGVEGFEAIVGVEVFELENPPLPIVGVDGFGELPEEAPLPRESRSCMSRRRSETICSSVAGENGDRG